MADTRADPPSHGCGSQSLIIITIWLLFAFFFGRDDHRRVRTAGSSFDAGEAGLCKSLSQGVYSAKVKVSPSSEPSPHRARAVLPLFLGRYAQPVFPFDSFCATLVA